MLTGFGIIKKDSLYLPQKPRSSPLDKATKKANGALILFYCGFLVVSGSVERIVFCTKFIN